jgi:hypothetical protein
MLACGELGRADDEIREIERKLKPLFGDFGFEFSAPHPARWYLRAPRESKLPSFHPPAAALGGNLADFLPAGDNAARWRQLLNESQVLLHNHPINAQRAERGAVAVNSLWFWGAGVLPDTIRSDRSHVTSDDAALHGLAREAQLPLVRADEFGALDPGLAAPMIDLREVRDPVVLETRWTIPAADARRRGALDALELASTDGRAFSYRHAHRWRFWRGALAR